MLRGLLSWLLGAGAGSQTVRTNLYAALIALLRVGRGEAGIRGAALELSERGKLEAANLAVVAGCGARLTEVIARDAAGGHEVNTVLPSYPSV